MTEPDPVGTLRTGRRHPWVTRAVTTIPLLAMTAAWTLVLGEQADAPKADAPKAAAPKSEAPKK